MKLKTILAAVVMLGAFQAPVQAAEYEIDPAHSFIEFRIQHIGTSWLYGRFNEISGSYFYDKNDPEASEISVDIDPASIDSNHAKRDKHLRGEDFLYVEEYPSASFKSTGYSGDAEKGTLEGELTLRGVTKSINIDIEKIGEGDDPWGGYRTGFLGTTTIQGADFGMPHDSASLDLQLELSIEGVRQ